MAPTHICKGSSIGRNTDLAARKNDNYMKKRKVELYEPISKYYIFCEGEKTEPNYFEGFKKAIETNSIYENRVIIHIAGTGSETKRVINAAEDFVNNNNVRNAEIWCVYDKDDFPAEDFNAVSEMANSLTNKYESLSYKVAWSNQCIEYWFILHFDYYDANNDRKSYRKYLHEKFSKSGLKRYEKNNPDIFKILCDFGDPKQAVRHAQRQLSNFVGKTDSESAPATKVHLLVEELSKYLPEPIKAKFTDC